MNTTSTQPSEESLKETCRYFVMPNLPRDVWYGYPSKPESADLVAFVEQRHAFIRANFDSSYVADALNEKATSAAVRAQAAMAGELAAQLRELLPFARLALDVEPVGGPDEPCSVNMGNAQIEFSESLLARFSATKSTKEATP